MKEVNYEFGECSVYCDWCGICSSYPTTLYPEAHQLAKSEGWLCRVKNGTYYDFCSQECCDAFYEDCKTDKRSK